MPTDANDTLLPFSLPSIGKKKVTAAFDAGQISSNGGVLLLAGADKRLGLIDMLAALIADHRDPALITHTLSAILRARVFAIACGYPDADDLDDLRKDPAFKLACGRLPETGDDLASQPTMSRWENAPELRTLIRLSHAMVDLWCKSDRHPPKAITLDIDDTDNTVHGHQPLSLFNAYHDERCFMPLHVYDAASGHCVLTVLRPGKTPDGREVRGHLRRLVRRIRRHWPNTVITIRGDSHYGRWEAMEWCEQNGVQYVFGLAGNKALDTLVKAETEAVDACWAGASELTVLRDYTETLYAADTWKVRRRVVARIEATYQGLDTRYVVTNIRHCGAQWLYDSLYCARGEAENLIKRHKGQLASDRTSCRSPLANQMRLTLHTAA
jgi:Transposase DDE domain group 1